QLRRAALTSVAAGLLSLLLAAPAAAHERRTVGDFLLVVGWADEPAYAGFKNAVQVRISEAASNQPVVDLAPQELKVDVSFGGKKTGPVAVEPRFRVGAFGTHGDYQASLIPSRPGPYTFRFVGTIKGQQVDQSFTSSETTFDSPEDPSEVEFPVKDPSRGELGSRIQRMEPRIDAARETGRRGVRLGTAGLVVAVLAVAGVLVSMRRRGAAPPVPAPEAQRSGA
ncbi:MAG: hypothetical protein ACRD0S_04075, partial [Acidimicrobiales bacterium]